MESSSASTQSLRALYASADAQREAVGRLTSMANMGDAVTEALATYEACAARIASLSLFSANEGADDIATAHLPYLLVPYRVAELVQRLPTSTPDRDRVMTERRSLLRRAREAYERFLHQLDGYGLLAAPTYTRLLEQYTEDPQHFSTVGGGGGTGTRLSSTGPAAALMDPAARRNAKIANFRAEKELRERLEVLRKRQDERRLRRRRQRQRIRAQDSNTAGDDADGTDAVADGHSKAGGGKDKDNSGEDDEDNDDEDDDDEEAARELYLAQLAYYAHMAFQGLDGINREDELLAMAPPPGGGGSSRPLGGLADGRQRLAGGNSGSSGGGYTDRLDQVVPRTGNLGRGGPLLTADGKPRQPFTILGDRGEMARSVFRPGHNLPTMSIDEYLEEERRRGGIIEGGGPSSGLPAEPDEDNLEKADAETMKARAWDEFVEANPRGSGNTLNRG